MMTSVKAKVFTVAYIIMGVATTISAQQCSEDIATSVFGTSDVSTPSIFVAATARGDDIDVCPDIKSGSLTCCTADGYSSLKTMIDSIDARKKATLSTWRTSWENILSAVRNYDLENFDDIFDQLPSSLKGAAQYLGFNNEAAKAYVKQRLASSTTESALSDAQVATISDKLERSISKSFEDAASYHTGLTCLVCHPDAAQYIKNGPDGLTVKMSRSTCDKLKQSQLDLKTNTWQALAEVAYSPYAALQKALAKTPMTKEEFIAYVLEKYARDTTTAQQLADTDSTQQLEDFLLGDSPSVADIGGVVATTAASRRLSAVVARQLDAASTVLTHLNKACDNSTAATSTAAQSLLLGAAPSRTFDAFAAAAGGSQDIQVSAAEHKITVSVETSSKSGATSLAGGSALSILCYIVLFQ